MQKTWDAGIVLVFTSFQSAMLIRYINHILWVCLLSTNMWISGTWHHLQLSCSFVVNSNSVPLSREVGRLNYFTHGVCLIRHLTLFMALKLHWWIPDLYIHVFIHKTFSFTFGWSILILFLARCCVSLPGKHQQVHLGLPEGCRNLPKYWSIHCYIWATESSVWGWLWSMWCRLDCWPDSEVSWVLIICYELMYFKQHC